MLVLGRRLFAFVLSVCLVALIMLDINPLYAPPNTDSGVFLYIGGQILKGNLPYVDVWDHKGPLIYYLDAFGLWVGHGSTWGIWLFEIALLTFAFFMIFEIIYRFGGVLSAVVGSLIGYHFLNKLVLGNLTEEYYFFFACLALFLYFTKTDNKDIYFAAIGAVSACGFLLRPNNIGVPVAIMLSMLIVEMRQGRFTFLVRRFLLFLAGLFCVILIFGVYFWLNNALADLIDQVFIFNIAYSRFYRSINITAWPQDPLLLWMSVIGYLIVFCVSIFTPLAKLVDERIAVLLMIGFPLEVVLISISGRGFDHYFINLQPYLILITSFVLALLVRAFSLSKNSTLDFALSFVLVLLFLFPSYRSLCEYFDIADALINHRADGIEKIPLVDRYIKENTLVDDKVLVWGHGGSINFLSRRDTPAQYLYQTGALFTPGYTTRKMSESFLNDLWSNPPALVVVSYNDLTSPFLSVSNNTYKDYLPPMYNEISSFFQVNYHLEAELQSINKKIYRLNSSIFPPH